MPLTSPRFAGNVRLQKAAANNPALAKGESGEAVVIVQQTLIDLGFAIPISTRKTGRPDGILGDETARTIKAFQAREGLAQDGIAGRDTLARLNELERVKLFAELTAPPPFRKWDGA
jgi:peptidoglycan hydrolase-like protein with peptidoglycan-binding domain